MVVLLYPSIANWFAEVQQARIITSYTSEVKTGIDPPAAEQLLLAHKYNAALSSGALVEANTRIPTGKGTSTDSALDYNHMLSADAAGVMARIRIPDIGVDLPVYHGTTDETLMKGAGHLEGTSLPVGGEGTHSVVTAHRGLATAKLFTDLNLVTVGDTFSIVVLDQVLTYRVVRTLVVEPDESEALRPVEGKDLVTLVTCTPLGINTQRILVTGERVYPTPVADVIAAAEKPNIPGFPWWIVILSAGTLLIALYVWRSGYPPRPRTEDPAPVGTAPAADAEAATGGVAAAGEG